MGRQRDIRDSDSDGVIVIVIRIGRRSVLFISPRGFELLTSTVFHHVTESIWSDP